MVQLSFPGESVEYRQARDRLLRREIDLRRRSEAVAAERRNLPPGGEIVEDYRFEGLDPDGRATVLRLSDLFAPAADSLGVYSYMFGPERDEPCPMCTHQLDALNGIIEHVEQRMNFAVVARSPLARLVDFAKGRGWRLRMLSTAGNTYNRDYHGELPAELAEQFGSTPGADTSMLNVFHREASTIRHFWASEVAAAPPDDDQEPRGTDPINPLWNLFDLIPEGRGTDWYPRVSYD